VKVAVTFSFVTVWVAAPAVEIEANNEMKTTALAASCRTAIRAGTCSLFLT
jgi:hypothetical protein